MDVHNEVGTGLKASLLMFVLILVGTLVYFVVRQNSELIQIYAAQDVDAIVIHRSAPAKIDSTLPAP
ncbi:MAG: hypothetical protein Q7K33_03060 [Candidatus Berkelbacteria bacterium]|nr:hypothetical protein [Candidatus Berkelbacteria bacterium]